MVSVVQFHPQSSAAALEPLAEGVAGEGRSLIARALAFAEPLYAGQVLSTGEPVWPHALGLGSSLAAVGLDPAARAAGVLFAAPKHLGGVESCSNSSVLRLQRSQAASSNSTGCVSRRAAAPKSRTRSCARWSSAWSRTCAWC